MPLIFIRTQHQRARESYHGTRLYSAVEDIDNHWLKGLSPQHAKLETARLSEGVIEPKRVLI